MHGGDNLNHRNVYAIHGLPKFSSWSFVLSLIFTVPPWGQLCAGQMSVEVETQSTDGEWCGVPQPWDLTLSSFPFLSCWFSSPLHRCYFLKGLTWTWQIVSWFTLMLLYNMWGISVALERCSKKPCSFSKELQIANSLKAVRNPTFFWSLGASTISIYFECCQGAASAFYSVIVLQNAE